MADAHGSGPCVRKDVGVQLPPRPPTQIHGCPSRVSTRPRAASAGAGEPAGTRRRPFVVTLPRSGPLAAALVTAAFLAGCGDGSAVEAGGAPSTPPPATRSGLLAPAALGQGWMTGQPSGPPRPDSALFCNGVGGYGFSPPVEHVARSFTGPAGATAHQGVLTRVDEETAAGLREAAADRGVGTARLCRETPERDEQAITDVVDEAAGTWERATRVTETLASGESATALLVGVRRGPVVGMLTARDDGSPLDAEAALTALRAAVCGVPNASGC